VAVLAVGPLVVLRLVPPPASESTTRSGLSGNTGTASGTTGMTNNGMNSGMGVNRENKTNSGTAPSETQTPQSGGNDPYKY
jgi:hypothetical protein